MTFCSPRNTCVYGRRAKAAALWPSRRVIVGAGLAVQELERWWLEIVSPSDSGQVKLARVLHGVHLHSQPERDCPVPLELPATSLRQGPNLDQILFEDIEFEVRSHGSTLFKLLDEVELQFMFAGSQGPQGDRKIRKRGSTHGEGIDLAPLLPRGFGQFEEGQNLGLSPTIHPSIGLLWATAAAKSRSCSSWLRRRSLPAPGLGLRMLATGLKVRPMPHS